MSGFSPIPGRCSTNCSSRKLSCNGSHDFRKRNWNSSPRRSFANAREKSQNCFPSRRGCWEKRLTDFSSILPRPTGRWGSGNILTTRWLLRGLANSARETMSRPRLGLATSRSMRRLCWKPRIQPGVLSGVFSGIPWRNSSHSRPGGNASLRSTLSPASPFGFAQGDGVVCGI